MNKWMALIIGIFVLLLGCGVAALTHEESAPASALVFFAGHILALLVFIIFLRKQTAFLLAGIMFQVIVILGLILGLLLLMPAWSGAPGQPEDLGMQDPLFREQAIEECAGEFKEGLAQLSKRYPELEGVEQFDHTYLGFTYVNNSVTPRVYIVLAVEDGLLAKVPVPVDGWEELKDIEVVCKLQLETGPNTKLKAEVEKLYTVFKAALTEKFNTRSLDPMTSRHLRRRAFQRHAEESSVNETTEEP